MLQNAAPALILLLVMMLVAWMLQRYRRHLPGTARHTGPALQVMNTLALGPQQRVVTLQVGQGESGVCLVLGVAPGGITALHTLPLPAADAGAAADTRAVEQPAAGFAARLSQLTNLASVAKGPHAPR
jgi:flagellar protein FliO/FliZ